MEIAKFKITNIHCIECIGEVLERVRNHPDISNLEINFTGGELVVSYDPERNSIEHLTKCINEAGFEAKLII